MASTLTWVVAGILVYTLGAMALQARGYLPDSVRVSGPIVTLHTKRGRAFLDRLARRRRFWRAWGNLGVGIALVVMVGFGAVVFLSAVAVWLQPEQVVDSPARNPQNVLVIPGVNEFLPLSVAPEIIAGLLVGMVVHEGGHGLLCRVEDIDIESMGVAMFAFIPVGAFVAPDEDSRIDADRGGQTRMFAAGVTNNFATTAIVLLLLFGPVAGSIGLAAGVPVGDALPGSAADEAEIGYGDRITAVNGTDVANETELDAALADLDGQTAAIELGDGETRTVERSVTITRTVEGVLSGVSTDGDRLPTIEAVNGTAVATEGEFREAVTDRPVATLSVGGATTTLPVGAYVVETIPDGPLSAVGAPAETSFVITAVDDRRVVDASALSAVLDGYDPGDRVTVTAFVDGERRTFEPTLGERDGETVVGVRIQSGYSGIVVDDFGIDAYPAGQFLSLLGGSDVAAGVDATASLFTSVTAVLLMPFLGAFDPNFAYNFAGFTAEVSNFYTVGGPLDVLGGGVFLLANLLFWTGWINFNLAVFNCVPAFPLDGGHILRTSTEAIVARLPIANRRSLATTITTAITLTMIVALVVMLFGPALLS